MDGSADAAVEAKVAGFIVWLAREARQVDKHEREPCVIHADRFLYWCAGRQLEASAAAEDAYLAELSRRGDATVAETAVTEASVADARAAIGLLRQYLATSPGRSPE